MPSPADPSPRRRRIAAVFATLALSAAALLLSAAPASAHDELLSSDPAADAALDEMPAALTLTFSGDLLGDAGATEVQVTDASGASVTSGAPTVQANVVTQSLAVEATGAMSVLWRAVSSDGHPISGQYAFSVSAPVVTTPPTATASPLPTPTPSPTRSESAPVDTAEPSATAAPAPADSAGAVPWVVFAVVGVALLGAVVYLLASRARRARELEEARMSGVSTATAETLPDAPAPGSDTPSER